ncbi:hypothetical protein MHYP_G00357040 [Metynnis hypsauchen]
MRLIGFSLCERFFNRCSEISLLDGRTDSFRKIRAGDISAEIYSLHTQHKRSVIRSFLQNSPDLSAP